MALHRPDPVTGDRLRTRVLGSADADAAAKTLFNTVGAARGRWAATPSAGPSCRPAPSRATTHLRAGHRGRARAVALVAAAPHRGGPRRGHGPYRATLELVEGVPLDGTLSGYSWWSAEGHERRVAGALVDGACELARLATGAVPARARPLGPRAGPDVDPYSEALTRAAMQVAAADGDADGPRREWVDCQRQVDELDPGSLPSERTERLYAELRREVHALAGFGPAD